jgi:hypothetical protein
MTPVASDTLPWTVAVESCAAAGAAIETALKIMNRTRTNRGGADGTGTARIETSSAKCHPRDSELLAL